MHRDDWKDLDWKRINPIHDDLLAKVRSKSGRAWEEASGELHSHHKEMPFWIVLHEDCDVREAHGVFREIVRPALSEIEPVQCTVGYSVVKDGKRRHYFLGTNAEILNEGDLLDD